MDIEDCGEKKNIISLNSLKGLKGKGLETLNIFQDCRIINIIIDNEDWSKLLNIVSKSPSAEEGWKQVLELTGDDERLDSDSQLDENNCKEKGKRFQCHTNQIGDFLVLGMCAMFVGNYQLAREFFVLIRNCSAVDNVPLMHC